MDYIRLFQDLLSIDTSVPPGSNYEKAIDLLEPFFRQAGCETQKVHIPAEYSGGLNGRLNLVINRRNPGKPRLIFYTHVDVVPAPGWDAFTPRIENGRIYGRGAVDMKGQIVSLLMALARLKDREINYDLSALITVDEETGHGDGNELRYIRPYIEPVTGVEFFTLDGDGGFVQVATLGVYVFQVTVYGKSVHQGCAYLGENAVENAVRLCQPLFKLSEEIIKRKSQVPADHRYGIPYLQPNLTISMMHGGAKFNIVPDECVITLARRIIPEEDLSLIEKEIVDVLRTVPGIKWDIQRVLAVAPVSTPLDDPAAVKLAGIIKEVTGKTGIYGEMGTLPFDPVTLEWKSRIFGTGLSRPDQNPHGINEFAYLKDVEGLAAIIEKFVTT